MRISVYSKVSNKENAVQLEKVFIKEGFQIDNDHPEVVVSVGGDGTFLRAIHQYHDIDKDIKYVGVNYGTLGFFSQYQKDEIDQLIKDLKTDNYFANTYRLLKGVATFEDETITIYSLNEIRIENPFHTLISDVYINGELLEKFRGNGLVISSSIGSSAYNKSLGGSLVDPSLPILELTEIAPIENNIYHSLGSSLVLKEDTHLLFKGEFLLSVVGYDYLNIDKKNLKSLEVTLSDKTIKVIYKKDYSLPYLYKRSFVK